MQAFSAWSGKIHEHAIHTTPVVTELTLAYQLNCGIGSTGYKQTQDGSLSPDSISSTVPLVPKCVVKAV